MCVVEDKDAERLEEAADWLMDCGVNGGMLKTL